MFTSSTSSMLLFPEEQLDSPVGYFPAHPGQSLEGGRWTIDRKLGWGPRSSTWLAYNSRNIYQAIKIFTVTATEDSTGNNERDLLLGPLKHIEAGVPRIFDSFYEHDAKGRRHLCLVLKVLSTSVEDLRLSNVYDGEYLPLKTVQKVIGDMSERLASLSFRQIVHGAVTPDNFHFPCVEASRQVQQILARFPSERAQKILSDGVTYTVVKSQPMPCWYAWDSPSDDYDGETIFLTNYSSARQLKSYNVTVDSRQNFYPPETLHSGRIDHTTDIWMLGCTAYLLLTGRMLFSDSYVASPVSTAKETFGKLETLLAESGKLAEQDIPPAASFLRLCLAIKPSNRATAMEIHQGGWAKKEPACSCGWDGP